MRGSVSGDKKIASALLLLLFCTETESGNKYISFILHIDEKMMNV